LPALYAQRGSLAQQGAKLLLVAVLADNESAEDAARALATWGVNAVFLVDSAGTGLREAGVTQLPATLVLDDRGIAKWAAPAGASTADVVAAAK